MIAKGANLTDHELLQSYVESQDVESLGAFLRRYQESVTRFVTRLLGDPEVAQDVVQETFLQAARHPGRLLKVDSCHNWLLRVARNIVMDHLRKLSRQRKHVAAVAEIEARRQEQGAAATHETAVEQAELHERVLAEIERLSPRHRELLLLRVEEQKSYREIAQITGLSATNVGFILHQAMKTLSRRLRGIAP